MIPTLADLIRQRGAQHPGRTAIVYAGRTTTYGELDRRSNQVAQALHGAGVGVGDRVAIIDRNGPEFFELLVGAAKLGAVLVPVNWRLAPPEMAFIVTDSAAKVLVLGPEVAEQLEAMGDLSTVETTVAIYGGGGLLEYEQWISAAGIDDPAVTTGSDDVVLQMYTSGTTGLPKGALLTNCNIGTQLERLAQVFGVSQQSTVLSVMPLYHMAGVAGGLIGLFCGGTVSLHREVDPAAIVDSIETDRVTLALLVPAVIQMVLAIPGLDSRDFSSLQALAYGASPIAETVLVRATAVFGDLYQVYGLTETTGPATLLGPADHRPDSGNRDRLRSAGQSLPGNELRIVGPSGAGSLSPGEVGEVWIRGAVVMKGYWNRPDDTVRAIDSEGWFRSGDAGYLDADGYLYIHDRLNDMIISGGENVYPAEVENVLMGHEAVADAAVIGVPDDRWGETVKAILVRAHDAAAVPDAKIVEFCRARLAAFKCPTSIDWVTVLPRNPSGKVLKRTLREPYWSGRTRSIN